MNEITLLAVTRMNTGLCIAGIGAGGAWVRPVRQFGTITLGDITYPSREVMQAFDVTCFPVLHPRPQPPHLEDHVTDFVRSRPRRVRALAPAERAAFLAAHAEPDADAVLRDAERSLCLVRAGQLDATFQWDSYTGSYEARLSVDGGRRPLPVTDLRWRALGRRLLGPAGGTRRYAWPELQEEIGTGEVYVAYGLSRAFEGQVWPLIVGVHPVPDIQVQLDYKQM